MMRIASFIAVTFALGLGVRGIPYGCSVYRQEGFRLRVSDYRQQKRAQEILCSFYFKYRN